MRISKYFNRPTSGVIFHKDKWKYSTAEMIKNVFYALLIIAIGASTVAMFLYALLKPDY